jgi:PPK2 family polyphosphate:nucleotide phosphotransferase
MKLENLIVEPGHKFRLSKCDPAETFGLCKGDTEKALTHHVDKLQALHELLYAENKRSVLIILQGMDASGKDGTIKHVMSGVNPQGCAVTSFKAPSPTEAAHDFLWRVHAAVPPRGAIGIFNRSHYEDVLIARVHDLVPKKVWARRYEQINAFEQMLTENGVHILKFFLHISGKEQEKRFEERLTDPHKNWKASAADFRERQYWNQYQHAYEDALKRCSTTWAPWYAVPSDHKWFRNYAVSEAIVKTLASLKMEYPKAGAGEANAGRANSVGFV